MFWQNMYLVFMDVSQHKSTPDQTVLTNTVNKLNTVLLTKLTFLIIQERIYKNRSICCATQNTTIQYTEKGE